LVLRGKKRRIALGERTAARPPMFRDQSLAQPIIPGANVLGDAPLDCFGRSYGLVDRRDEEVEARLFAVAERELVVDHGASEILGEELLDPMTDVSRKPLAGHDRRDPNPAAVRTEAHAHPIAGAERAHG